MHEPPAGPKKFRYIAPDGTFPKILSILQTLVPRVLELQDFPGPLAFSIRIYMVLAPAGQLFDLTTGPRDIQDFVQKFSENPHALLK